MITVVIPTRNRSKDLRVVLRRIAEQILSVDEVIIVDSSDFFEPILVESSWPFSIQHHLTKIQSAAVQRSIGMDKVSANCEFLAFLDDDVEPAPSYTYSLLDSLQKGGGIGISGVVVNCHKGTKTREKPNGVFGKLQVFFGLDSNVDGKLLPSGVNVPVRKDQGRIQEVDWLIGCSIWRFSLIRHLRFESDFTGQSLGEDVAFSSKASKFGKLLVDPNVHLLHNESQIGRPVGREFWSMWVVNRKRIIEIATGRSEFLFHYHLANFGQFVTLMYTSLFSESSSRNSALGILDGYRKLANTKTPK